MKILWISPWFGNYRIPVYEYLNKLCGGNFFLICSKENTSDLVRNKLRKTLGNNAIILSGEKRITMGDESSDFANTAVVIKKQPGLYSKIKKINADIVITEGFGSWSPAGILYAVLHRKKLCMFYERTAYVERNCPIWRKLYRRIIGIPVKCFFINGELTKEYLTKNLHFAHTPKITGCMSADSYELAKAVKSFRVSDKIKLNNSLNLNKGLTFLFIGQMVERKGIKELLSVWKKHIIKYPNDNLIVIGKGVLLDLLKNKYKNEKSIHILGEISYDLIYRYYAICDVFIMPTLEDNWCLVIPEAMACSKPIACSLYNGGHYELVQEGINGYKFDPLSPISILETLDKFHFANLVEMGKKSAEIESLFTPDKAANRIYNACLKIIKS